MAQYDLTHRLGQYLDRHMVFPLLEFLSTKEIYSEADMLQVKIDLLSDTNMIDFTADLYKQLHESEDVPEGLLGKREHVVKRLKELEQEVAPVVRVFEDEDAVSKLVDEPNHAYLEEHFGFRPQMVDVLYQYAKFQFDCGNYTGAAEYLFHYRLLSQDPLKSFSALWGKLASEILMQNWEGAYEDMMLLKDNIEQKQFQSPALQLQQSIWLIHWSLFVFFNHPKGRDGIIDLFFQPTYLIAIQTACPHILRYLTTAVITNKLRRDCIKDLVKVIQEESYTYQDPITGFVECLFVKFDFDGAQKKLRECEQVLVNDFFLVACHDEFMENARLFIFETYCRIHQVIDITMLSEKLDMSSEEAERWIVELIRNARLDAKIDSQRNHIVMGTQSLSVYQQVVEKTRNLGFRTNVIANSVDSKLRSSKTNKKIENDFN